MELCIELTLYSYIYDLSMWDYKITDECLMVYETCANEAKSRVWYPLVNIVRFEVRKRIGE